MTMRSMACGACLALCAAFGAGCSNLDFTPPPTHFLTSAFDSGKPYIEDEPRRPAEAPESMQRLQQLIAAWEKSTRTEDDYRIGAGDVLRVGVLALDKPGEVTVITPTVGGDGMINLPLAGDLPAVGQGVRQLRDAIAARYTGKYLREPEVTVSVQEYRSAAVLITGAVRKPGVYYLKRNTSTVLELLFEAGGLDAAAGQELFILRNESVPQAGARTAAAADFSPPERGGARDLSTNAPPAATLPPARAEAPAAAPPAAEPARPAPPPRPGSPLRRVSSLFGLTGGRADAGQQPAPAPAPPPDENALLASPGQNPAGAPAPAAAPPHDVLPKPAPAASEAGEPAADAARERRNQMIKVDLKRLVDGGDVRLNVSVRSGDIVTVPAREKQFVYVLGYVANPGSVELPTDRSMTAMDVLARAGGLSRQSRAEKSCLIRETPEGKKLVNVDLIKIARGERPDFKMKDRDMLIIGSGMLMKFLEIFNIGGGVNYSPIP